MIIGNGWEVDDFKGPGKLNGRIGIIWEEKIKT